MTDRAIAIETLTTVARALFGMHDADKSTDKRLIFPQGIELNLVTGIFYDVEADDVVSPIELVRRHFKIDERLAENYLGRFIRENVFFDSELAWLPEELQLERDLIGICIVRPDIIGQIEEEIGPTEFYSDVHGRLFGACLAARENPEEFAPGITGLLKAVGGDPNATVFSEWTVARYVAYLARAAPFAKGEDLATTARALARKVRELVQLERGEIEPEPPPRESRFGLVMWSDQNQPGEQYDYLIEDLIPEKEAVLIYGETGSGKSFCTMDMALCGVRGVHFFDRRVLKPFGVVYCAYEAGKGYRNRMRAYSNFHRLEPRDLAFGVLTRPVDLWSSAVNVDQLIEEIMWVQETKFGGVALGAVVIDTHNAATPGASEIDSKEASQIRDRYRKIMAACNCGVWIVGHKNASGKHRGNEQLYNNIDTAIDISRKVEFIDKISVPLRDKNGTPIRVARVAKQREGADGETFEFILPQVGTGATNKYGREQTSCVMLTPARDEEHDAATNGAAAPTGPRPLSAEQRVILQALKDAIADHGEERHGPNMPPEIRQLPKTIGRVVKWLTWQDYYKKKAEPDAKPNTINQRMKRSGEVLLNRQIIGRINPYVWVIPFRRNGAASYGEPLPLGDLVPAATRQNGPGSDKDDNEAFPFG